MKISSTKIGAFKVVVVKYIKNIDENYCAKLLTKWKPVLKGPLLYTGCRQQHRLGTINKSILIYAATNGGRLFF
jgi:hypothetical protein